MSRTALGAVALLAAGGTAAEQYRECAGYEVHYNAFRADFVPDEVARLHGLTRSRNRGLVNVTVLRAVPGAAAQTAEAAIELSVSARDGVAQPVRMRPLRDSGALNYLGEFRIAGADSYHFEVRVTPGDALRGCTFSFAQTLVAD